MGKRAYHYNRAAIIQSPAVAPPKPIIASDLVDGPGATLNRSRLLRSRVADALEGRLRLGPNVSFSELIGFAGRDVPYIGAEPAKAHTRVKPPEIASFTQ